MIEIGDGIYNIKEIVYINKVKCDYFDYIKIEIALKNDDNYHYQIISKERYEEIKKALLNK